MSHLALLTEWWRTVQLHTAVSCQSAVIGLENNVCELAPLSYIDVCINGVKRTALIDGGSEIPLIRADVLGPGLIPSVGSIIVQPIIGPGVHCKLSAVDVTRYVNECQVEQSMDARPVHIVFAVTNDMVGHDVVLPASVVDQLKDTSQYVTGRPCVTNVCAATASALTAAAVEVNDLEQQDNVAMAELDTIGSSDIVNCINVDCVNTCSNGNIADANTTPVVDNSVEFDASKPITSEVLAAEQASDETLSDCRVMADAAKGGFYWRNNLLYHADQVLGQRVEQLCVPKCMRNHVLNLAHEQCGAHLAGKKTSERVRFSFYWPSLKKDVFAWCDSCAQCQMRRRVTVMDRVPITPITRPEVPGQQITIDVIGPIEPASGGYRYLLTAVDHCTRWPSAFLLRNLTAQAACNVLLELFSQLGVCSTLICDNGTNFVSKLTQ
jgi:Integrase zinc binding domain/Integrase core domain